MSYFVSGEALRVRKLDYLGFGLPRIAVFPSLVLFVTLLSFGFLGDRLRKRGAHA